MSELASQHAAHRERLMRLGALARPAEDQNVKLIEDLNKRIKELETLVKRQDSMITAQGAYIEKLAGVAADSNPKIDEIFHCCCKYFGVSPADMRSPSKALGLPFRRQIFYFLGREYGYSLHQIGRHIHKDHSCVVYGSQKISTLLKTDDGLRNDITLLKEKIAARAFERRYALEEILNIGARAA